MHRFFVPAELLKATSIEVSLPKELAHQVRDVIRLDIGEQLLLLDNSGDEILATVAKTNKASVEVHLLERRQMMGEKTDTPSSVPFSRIHSKRVDLSIPWHRIIRTAGSLLPGRCSSR